MEVNFIRQMLHQENSPSAGLVDILGIGGVWQAIVIESFSLILYRKKQFFLVRFEGNKNLFCLHGFVPVKNGIIYCFGKRNKDITIVILIYMVFFANLIDQFF